MLKLKHYTFVFDSYIIRQGLLYFLSRLQLLALFKSCDARRCTCSWIFHLRLHIFITLWRDFLLFLFFRESTLVLNRYLILWYVHCWYFTCFVWLFLKVYWSRWTRCSSEVGPIMCINHISTWIIQLILFGRCAIFRWRCRFYIHAIRDFALWTLRMRYLTLLTLYNIIVI